MKAWLKKIRLTALILAAAICLAACGGEGVVIDEEELIDGNGTESLVKAGVSYTLDGDDIYKDGAKLVTVEGVTENKLFALGEYLYVNTSDGAKQITLDGSKVKKFGKGEILAAKGRWIYYTSEHSKVRGMSLYKIDMKTGKELLMYEGETKSFVEKDGVFTFLTESGEIYQNKLDEDEATLTVEASSEEESQEEATK